MIFFFREITYKNTKTIFWILKSWISERKYSSFMEKFKEKILFFVSISTTFYLNTGFTVLQWYIHEYNVIMPHTLRVSASLYIYPRDPHLVPAVLEASFQVLLILRYIPKRGIAASKGSSVPRVLCCFWGKSILFSREDTPVNIPTSSKLRFSFPFLDAYTGCSCVFFSMLLRFMLLVVYFFVLFREVPISVV